MILSRVIHNIIYILLISNVVICNIPIYQVTQSGSLALYNNQINARALIGQSAVGYCAGKPTEKSRTSELLYKSNRPQVSMGYRLINHLGCWKNTRRIRNFVVYEFVSCSTNIPSGLSAYNP